MTSQPKSRGSSHDRNTSVMAVIHLAPSWVHVRVTNKVHCDTPKPRDPLPLPVVRFVEKLERGKNILIASDPETSTEFSYPRCPHTPLRGAHVTACDLSENYAVHVVALPSRNVPPTPSPAIPGRFNDDRRSRDGRPRRVLRFSFSFSSLPGRPSIGAAQLYSFFSSI